jgi:hypothetical protein
VLAGLYFGHYPVPSFFLRLREAAAAAAFLAVCAAAGGPLARRLGLLDDGPEGGPGPGFLWSAGLGLGLMSLALLALGVAGLFRPVAFAALSAVALAAGWDDLRRWARVAAAYGRELPDRQLAVRHALLAAFAAAALGLAFLCALAPPTYYDSLVYHLALPAKYLQEGRVAFVAFNQYAHFPQNMEMVFGWFLALGDDVSAQLFNVILMGLTGAAVLRAAPPRDGGRTVRWDLWLLLGAPCTLLLASETYVEVPLALLTWLAVRAAGEGWERNDRRRLVAAGLLGGFAAGVKYTGAMTPALLTLLVLAAPRRRGLKDRVIDAAALALPALAAFAPWMVKNAVFTGGNPVFPFLPSLFPATNVHLPEQASAAYFRVLDEYKGTSSLLLELFGLPLRLLTDTVSFGGGYDVTGDLGWALPLLLLPLAFVGWKRDRARAFLLAYVVAHVAVWASLRPVLRFLYPVFPLVCVLAGDGLGRAVAQGGRWARTAAVSALALFSLSNAVLFYLVERVRDPFPTALGLEEREDYLNRKLGETHAAMAFLNRELPEGSRVLFFGDQRGYYCRRPYLAPMVLLPQPLHEWAEAAGTGRALRAKLVEYGFSHLLVHRREAERVRSYGILKFGARGGPAWEELLAATPPLYDSGGVAVYRLTEGPAGG